MSIITIANITVAPATHGNISKNAQAAQIAAVLGPLLTFALYVHLPVPSFYVHQRYKSLSLGWLHR